MAKPSKRAWKLQDFQCHAGAVNCLAIGHKSGKVMVTGGDDRKVNLWAVGKTSCILSLKGHTSPIDSVRFNSSEDMVAAGSQSGALKIWNLEASKILRTLSGHKSGIRSLDFHPFGEVIASGSMDTNIKLWDFRKKGCILTYKGHTNSVNSLRFSPDGKWIVSASDDHTAKLWDMMSGRLVAEFKQHTAPVTSVEFHPIDFLLVTGSLDKTLKFWDLETFQMVSSTDGDCGPIRSVFMHPEGKCAYASCQDNLMVYGWEPSTSYDTVNVGWGKPADIVVHQDELIGASFQQSNVSIYIADLQKISPIGGIPETTNQPSPFTQNPTRRRSFITRVQHQAFSKCHETAKMKERKNDEEEKESYSHDDFEQLPANYSQVFQPKNELPRDISATVHEFDTQQSFFFTSPPANPELPSLPTNLNSLPQSARSPVPDATKPLEETKPQQPTSSEVQPSRPVIKRPPTTGFSKVVREKLKSAEESKPSEGIETARDGRNYKKMESEQWKNTFECVDIRIGGGSNSGRSVPPHIPLQKNDATSHHLQSNEGLNVNIEDFMPKSQHFTDDLDDEKAISFVRGGHQVQLSVLTARHRNVQVFKTLWTSGNIKVALDSAKAVNDQSILQDVIHLLLQRPSSWTLETCSCVLPVVSTLISGRYETHVNMGLNALKFILRTFAILIKDTISNVSSIGVDISREERYNKSINCHKMLMAIKSDLEKKSFTKSQNLQIKEIKLLLSQLN